MKVRLVLDDWRKVGHIGSIYHTELGMELSSGDMHSGTIFDAELKVSPEVEKEIHEAMQRHQAYPVFCCIVPVRLNFPMPK